MAFNYDNGYVAVLFSYRKQGRRRLSYISELYYPIFVMLGIKISIDGVIGEGGIPLVSPIALVFIRLELEEFQTPVILPNSPRMALTCGVSLPVEIIRM